MLGKKPTAASLTMSSSGALMPRKKKLVQSCFSSPQKRFFSPQGALTSDQLITVLTNTRM
jgi:hypothetical protein